MPRLRALAIGLFRRGGAILVAEGRDSVKGQTYYRPIGGEIEFGERAAEALAREVREELALEVRDVRYLFTLENLFTYEGSPGHEIVLVHDAAFADPMTYARDGLSGEEHPGDGSRLPYRAAWKPLAFFRGGPPLYPDGLLERLEDEE